MYSSIKDNIWDADLADMHLVYKHNQQIRFLLCVIDIFSESTCVVPLKYNKSITITITFQQTGRVMNQTKQKQIKVINFIIDQ